MPNAKRTALRMRLNLDFMELVFDCGFHHSIAPLLHHSRGGWSGGVMECWSGWKGMGRPHHFVRMPPARRTGVTALPPASSAAMAASWSSTCWRVVFAPLGGALAREPLAGRTAGGAWVGL